VKIVSADVEVTVNSEVQVSVNSRSVKQGNRSG